jgi:phosphatidate phosphatase APP1
MNVFPEQQFILLGDNSQSDPDIYAAIAQKFPEKIVAIYIRNISNQKKAHTMEVLGGIRNERIQTCVFEDNEEAIRHSKTIGLIV